MYTNLMFINKNHITIYSIYLVIAKTFRVVVAIIENSFRILHLYTKMISTKANNGFLYVALLYKKTLTKQANFESKMNIKLKCP